MSETAENVTRDLSERATSYAKEAYGKTQTAAVQATKAMEQTYSAASKGAADFNLQLLDMAQANINAAFEFAREANGVKSPSEFFALAAAHMRKQFERFSDQASRLTNLAQKVTTEAAQPLQASAETAARRGSRQVM